ncbi:ScbR family autoregulator-binding transcription factor [Streptomyces sp. NPDC060322]|uniref:ScbR family autoregulator-binding transcription factor n=1 Tax=unclassified Streptomyces TaxID=2593676 RepID=UPI003659C94E
MRTREALIKSAAEIFGREGFSAAPLTVISSTAGVSNGALHFHFPNKAALARAVQDSAALRLAGITERVTTERTPHLQALVDATYALVLALADDVILRAGFALSGEGPLNSQACLRRNWQRWVGETLERARAEGELREGVASQDGMATVVALTLGLEMLSLRDPSWRSPQVLGRFWQLLLPGLAATAVRGRLMVEGSGTDRVEPPGHNSVGGRSPSGVPAEFRHGDGKHGQFQPG